VDRLRLATVWLGGCSGCHMSFLDLDEWLIELASFADVVYSPVMDVKEFPAGVDAVLVEGAVNTEDNLAMIRRVRDRSRLLVAFGDCAVTGNVTALRNPAGPRDEVLAAVYRREGDLEPRVPSAVPRLLERAHPVHTVVAVDLYMPGCPPPAPRIRAVLEDLGTGRVPQLRGDDIKFG
jgi:NAD-reducing hydrogenase small subunit